MDDFNLTLRTFDGQGIDNPFVLSDYINKHRLSKTRLYLYAKKKSVVVRMYESCVDSDDDFSSACPFLSKANHIDEDTPSQHAGDSSSTLRSEIEEAFASLIGTSEERDKLSNEIDTAYEASVKVDSEREQLLKEEAERKEQVRIFRQQQLEEEPDLTLPHHVIFVRHPNLGMIKRLFSGRSTISSVYYWVGGLAAEPEQFSLCVRPNAPIIKMSTPVSEIKSVLMVDSDSLELGTYILDSEVNHKVRTSSIEPVNESESILTVDSDSHTGSIEASSSTKKYPLRNRMNLYEELEELRNSINYSLPVDEKEVSVYRESIYHDMLNLFAAKGFEKKMMFIFEGEDAGGDGVSKDAISEFYRAMLDKFEGTNEKVPPSTIDDDELVMIGRIITYFFITHNVFPLQVCHASLKNVLYGSVSDNELLKSFRNFLHNGEVSILDKFKGGDTSHLQAIVDIFSDSKVFCNPRPENIDILCVKAAKTSLIRFPLYAFQSIKDGMGDFWKSVTVSQFDNIMDTTTPDPDKIIDSLMCEESGSMDQNITSYLHRYIRMVPHEGLLLLLRFATASSQYYPDQPIKVTYENQDVEYLRPRAKTCFRILILPRQYSSFSQFCKNLSFHLGDKSNWYLHD